MLLQVVTGGAAREGGADPEQRLLVLRLPGEEGFSVMSVDAVDAMDAAAVPRAVTNVEMSSGFWYFAYRVREHHEKG